MAGFDHLQQILGTNSKNRVFSVHRHSESGDLHVYFGMELFEIVPDDKDNVQFKLMVAHMRNAGASGAELQRAFTIDPRTSKKWANALKSGDGEKLSRALDGVYGGRKLTRPIEQYIRVRFPYIYTDDRYTYSSKLRKEIKQAFDVELSSETLRPLLKELKNQFNGEDGDDDEDQNQDNNGSTDSSSPPNQDEPDAGDPPIDDSSLKHSEAVKEAEIGVADNRRSHVDFSTPHWCSHLGLLIFNQSLQSMQAALTEKYAPAICQWTSHVLMGAPNVEQTKLQSRSDIATLWGMQPLGSPSHQRQKLGELAIDPKAAQEVLRWNFNQLDGDQISDLYFDPHTKHYTGKQNILKGWCSKIRWADKILNGDYVHTTTGAPVYLENTDNYDDIRARFRGLENRFRNCFSIPVERELTWIVDRGIYSSEIFEWIIQQPHIHLITWEKGYKRDRWKDGRESEGEFIIERARNHSQDLKTYRFEWIEQPWPANTEMRQIIVRATNPNGNRIEVSILCDDKERDAKEIIWLMFDRWVQENDFKYMDAHFGINQITSYQSQTYAQIREELDDRMMKNAAYTALETARRDEKTKVGKWLYQNRESLQKDKTRQARIAVIEALLERSAAQRKELGSLRGAQKSAERHRKARETKIEAAEVQINKLSQQLATEQKEISRIDTLIEREAVRLVGDRKYLMDVIKLTARNLFYAVLAPFKELYDNYRDDHTWFRHLTYSPGLIEQTETGDLKCQLISPADYPTQVRKFLAKMLDQEINQAGLKLLDGTGRGFQITLGDKSTIGSAN